MSVRLTRIQYGIIDRWLGSEEIRAWAIQFGASRDDLATKFNLEHADHPAFQGIVVTKHHIYNSLKSMGLEYPRGKARKGSRSEQVKKLQEKMSRLGAQVDTLFEIFKTLFSGHLAEYPKLEPLFVKYEYLRCPPNQNPPPEAEKGIEGLGPFDD